MAIVVGAIMAVGGLAGSPSLAYTGPDKIASTSDSNHPSHWGAGCTKLDKPGGLSWEADADYSKVVLKAAQWDYVFYDVVKGDVLEVEQNAISHFIFCPPAPTTTTTTIPKTTTTIPETTTTVPKTTTTVPETTTTVPETTTTVPETTTTVPETTTTVPETTTTVPETTTTVPETTTTVPEVTTTTVAEATTTTVAEATTTTVAETTTTTEVGQAGPTTTSVPAEPTTTVPDEPTTTEVVGQAGPTTTAAGGAGVPTTVSAQLPQTGSDGNATMLVLGGLLVMFGAVLLLTARRPVTI